jgi:hypothetical protein
MSRKLRLKLKKHVEIWPYQRSKYLSQKEQLSLRQLLAIMDFSQMKETEKCEYVQDLIITFYYLNNAGNMEHENLHFVGRCKGGEYINDVSFVEVCWDLLFKENYFDRFDKLFLWSDGGRKHFKQSYCLSKFAQYQEVFKIKIEYNFFATNHGYGACDAASSHANRQLKKVADNDKIPVNSSEQIVKIINTINNHEARLCPPIDRTNKRRVKTFKGISSDHCFTFENSFEINAFEKTGDVKIKNKFFVEILDNGATTIINDDEIDTDEYDSLLEEINDLENEHFNENESGQPMDEVIDLCEDM